LVSYLSSDHDVASTDLLNAAIDGLGYGAGTGLITAGDDHEPTARGFVWRELLRKGGVEAAYSHSGKQRTPPECN
jgi:hypothetical protein